MWYDIENFDNYKIDKRGRILSLISNKILSCKTKGQGKRYCVQMTNNEGKRKHKYIHRLLAETFIPNPDNLYTVNHKNGNRYDNRLGNLEWMSLEDNINHAKDNGLHRKYDNIEPYAYDAEIETENEGLVSRGTGGGRPELPRVEMLLLKEVFGDYRDILMNLFDRLREEGYSISQAAKVLKMSESNLRKLRKEWDLSV